MSKYLSIITNFGCHYECPYCIVRENNLRIPKTTLEGLNNLRHEIISNKCDWVSISGGGDPLYDFWKHIDWWYKLLEEIPTTVMMELHTSYLDMPSLAYKGFSRIVYHLRDVSSIANVRRYDDYQKVRVVFVVTEDFTPELINNIVKAVKANNSIDELSFRQMVDNHYQTTHYCEEYLRAGHKRDWYYVEQDDYNLYYCENKVNTRFEDFKKDKANDEIENRGEQTQ